MPGAPNAFAKVKKGLKAIFRRKKPKKDENDPEPFPIEELITADSIAAAPVAHEPVQGMGIVVERGRECDRSTKV